jgi:ABC-type sugar transport system, permease component
MQDPNWTGEVIKMIKENKMLRNKVILYAVVIVISCIVIIPFLWMLLLSFKTDTEIVNAPFAIPKVLNFDNYVRALNTLRLPQLYKNTFIVVATTQVITLCLTFMSSFAISRMNFRNRKVKSSLYFYLIFGLAIPVYILLFPIYRINIMLGIMNTYLALIIPYIAISIAFNTLLFVGFLNGVPDELEEAAIIDGCGIWNLCIRVIAPVLKPIFATVTVFNVIYNWNEFPFAVTFISSRQLFTISLGVSLFKGRFNVDYSGVVAASVLIMIPQLLFYTLLQKYIISGMTEGAVKG